MKKYNRDDIGQLSRFIKIPAEDSNIALLARYFAFTLVEHHRFTDKFISFFLSVLPEERVLTLVQDSARIAAQVLEEDEDIGSDLRETALSTTRPGIPREDIVSEFYKAAWAGSDRAAIIARVHEELAASLADDGLDAAAVSDERTSMELLRPLMYTESVENLAGVFSLSPEDVCIVSMFLTYVNHEKFEYLVDEWTRNEQYLAFEYLFHLPRKKICERLGADEKLRRNGILEVSSARRGYEFTLNDDIVAYLTIPGSRTIHEDECVRSDREPYPIGSFYVDRVKEDTVVDLLSAPRPANIFLYGKEGTGKTEYARALAKAAGKALYEYRQDGTSFRGKDDLFRLSLITASANPEEMILLVDEADSILSTSPGGFFSFFGSAPEGSKSRVNDLLDNTKCSIIWISNRVRQIDASTKRRFTYSIEFTALPPRAIREHTVNKLAPFGLAASTVEEIASIAARSGLNAASVTFLAEAVAALPKDLLADTAEAKGELLRRVKSIFDANSRLITGTVPFRTKTGSAYSVAALNTSVDATKIVEAISRYYDAEERGLDLETGLRILLYGESGTGKTEFARYIAETLGRPLLIKRASDILSPWVGVSEQQVAEIFREAEETRSILLLDEADSFFSSRENATRNWERTLVNEFLTRMEDFRGVLLCATNAPATLDRAVMRRFHEAVEFYTLSAEGITELLDRYFPEIGFTDSQILDLFMNGSLTPGDFAALRGRLNFHPVTADAAYITESLAELSKARRGE